MGIYRVVLTATVYDEPVGDKPPSWTKYSNECVVSGVEILGTKRPTFDVVRGMVELTMAPVTQSVAMVVAQREVKDR